MAKKILTSILFLLVISCVKIEKQTSTICLAKETPTKEVKTYKLKLAPIDFGAEVKFDSINWWQISSSNVKVKAASGPLATWGFWIYQIPRSWSEFNKITNGKKPDLPPGRHLKLIIEYSAAEPELKPPLKKMTITYTPVNGPKVQKTLTVDLSKTAPRENIAAIDLTDKIKTPHIKWAKPYLQGKIKALFLTPFYNQREVIELSQRMDLDFSTVTFASLPAAEGVSSPFRSRLSMDAVLKELQKKLQQQHYDVIVVCGANWVIFSDEIWDTILSKVSNGTGLVLNTEYYQGKEGHYAPGMPEKLKTILPFRDFVAGPEAFGHYQGEMTGSWKQSKKHFLTSGIPFEILPKSLYFKFASFDQEKILANVNNDPLMGISKYGKGRIVAFTYGTTALWPINGGLTPYVDYLNISFNYWEYYHSLLAKSLLWAADKQPQVLIENIVPTKQHLSFAELQTENITLKLNNSGQEKDLNIELSIKDRNSNEQQQQTIKTKLSPGQKDISFKLTSGLRPGLNLVDIIIKDNQNNVLNWGSTYFELVSPAQISHIDLDKELYLLSDVVTGTVKIINNSPASDCKDRTLLIKLFDGYNRLIHLDEKKIDVDDTIGIPFSINLKDSMTTYITVRCELTEQGRITDVAERDFIVKLEPKWDDYVAICWLGLAEIGMNQYLYPYFLDVLDDMGFTVLFEDSRASKTFPLIAKNNFRLIPNNIGRIAWHGYNSVKVEYEKQKDKSLLVRNPDLSNPTNMQNLKNAVQGQVKNVKKYGPFGYSLGDENSLLVAAAPCLPGPTLDICFSRYCLAKLRIWLRKKYHTLKSLNEQWETNFTNWQDVEPFTFEQAKDRPGGNYSPWADHRTFMENVFADTFSDIREAILQIDPSSRVGVSGTGPPSAYTGFDYFKLAKIFDYMNMYLTVSDGELWRSFSKGNITLWSGYGEPTQKQEHYIWWAAFHGHKGAALWYVPMFIKPDLTFYSHGILVKNQVKELTEGLGKLLMTAQRQDNRIAIHYSQPSLHAAWISGDEIKHLDALDTFVMYVQSAGLQFNFVSYEQIEAGELEKGGYKALILPHSQAISTAEAAKIKDFVAKGGLLIADVLPGIMDDHCKLLEAGLLDDIFGIKTKGNSYSKTFGKVIADKNNQFDLLALNKINGVSEIELTDGRALAKFKTPKSNKRKNVLIVNNFRKGKAVYLNFFFSNLVDNYLWSAQSLLLSRILQLADIERTVNVTNGGKSIPYYEIVSFKNSSAEYIGILRDYRGGEKQEPLKITFPRQTHLYDIREKSYLGKISETQTQIAPGCAKIYALLPYQVKDIEINATDNIKAGQKFDYQFQLTATADKLANHVVRIEIYNPKGKLIKHYSRNELTKAGFFKGSFKSALNDSAGTWKLKAIDIISKISSEKTFSIN